MGRAAFSYSSAHPSVEYVSHRGPHPVGVGDLAAIGMPGVVFAPTTGPRCPAIVFGHALAQPVRRYADTMRHLASWGFVVAAPATERGLLPSHRGLAFDLAQALARLAEAKLGGGRVTIDAGRLGVAGHGIGGSAAVLAAAAGAPAVRAVMTIAASPTSPSAATAAASLTVPGLHMVGVKDTMTSPAAGDTPEGERLARAWAGPVQLRRVKGDVQLGFPEGTHVTSYLLGTKPSADVQHTVRTVVAAFALCHVAGEEQLADGLAGPLAGSRLVEPAMGTAGS